MVKSICNEAKIRWRIICLKERNPERKIFAALELFCFPASIVTLFILLPGQMLATQCAVKMPFWWKNVALVILLSAAIGYMTNYIALEMLFKPYRKTGKHPLAWLSFGYWQQGMIPKNKNRIGMELGHQIETKLLDPETLADDLCWLAGNAMQNPELTGKIRESAQTMLREHQKKIVVFLVPQIENSLYDAIEKIITKEKLLIFWDHEVAPRLQADESRMLIAHGITDGLQRRSPELIEILKTELQTISREYLSRKLPLGFGADTLSEGLVQFIDWQKMEQRLRYRLGEDSTLKMIREELQSWVGKLDDYLKSSEAEQKVNEILSDAKQKLHIFLAQYLHETLPVLAVNVIESESLWDWVEAELLPAVKPKLEQMIRTYGKDQIVDKLNLSRRITEAVEKQDVEDFHKMLTSIAAEHLGAIQVLGYILGAIVGIAQFFI